MFFGPQGDTRWNQRRLQEQLGERFQHTELDIRDRQGVLAMMAELRPDAIVHTAAQPSPATTGRRRSPSTTSTPIQS